MLRHPPTSNPPLEPSNPCRLLHTDHSDHYALALTIPSVGTPSSRPTPHTTPPTPTTRSHQAFLLPIPPNLIEQYKLGTTHTTDRIQTSRKKCQHCQAQQQLTTTHIDTLAATILTVIDGFHSEAVSIRPMRKPPPHPYSTPNTKPRFPGRVSDRSTDQSNCVMKAISSIKLHTLPQCKYKTTWILLRPRP